MSKMCGSNASSKSQTSCATHYTTFSLEPSIGYDPTTCTLQVCCTANCATKANTTFTVMWSTRSITLRVMTRKKVTPNKYSTKAISITRTRTCQIIQSKNILQQSAFAGQRNHLFSRQLLEHSLTTNYFM